MASADDIWPRGTPLADPTKLIETVEELAKDFRGAKRVAESPPAGVFLKDLPDSCLDGRLGEICSRRLSDLPRAYSWPSTLAAASARIDRRAPGVRTNLYAAVVGPVHSGKSQSIERACATLGVESPVLMEVMSGSAEQLIRKTKDAAGNPRLFSPDELGHMLEKMRIERSSFSFVLNTAYYKDRFEVLMGRRETATFNCVLSIIGGLVEDRFQELFNAATCGGLYDRFLFGLCPGNFHFDYAPFEGEREEILPTCVNIHHDVWNLKSDWLREFPDLNARVVENAIRCATVCAAFDGKQLLQPKDLDPHLELVRYQTRIRAILKPNPGETIEGRLANKFLDYLARHNGAFVAKRRLLRDTRGYDFGPTICDRALAVLIANGDVARTTVGRQELLRLVQDAELDAEGKP